MREWLADDPAEPEGGVAGMTGRELCEWILKHRAEDMDVLWIASDGIVWDIRPMIERGDEIIGGGPDGAKLDGGKEYLTL